MLAGVAHRVERNFTAARRASRLCHPELNVLVSLQAGAWDGVKNYIPIMPRKARINHPGLTHHIMARTFNDMLLFGDDADRSQYVSLLSKRVNETGFLCYAWALMNTHVHLLVRTTELPLWRLMKPLQCDYAHYFNRKYGRRGPLFCDRYKSIATQDQSYLERLIRYIHLNPVRAGVCKTLGQLDRYQWTGHRGIVENDPRGFQEIRQVLRRFGKTTADAQSKYREFIQAGMATNPDDDLLTVVRASNQGQRDKNSSGHWVIGDVEFQKTVIARDAEHRLTLARYRREGMSLETVLSETAKRTAVEARSILRRSWGTPAASARMIFCFFARELGFPTRDIGKFLGIQQAAASNAARGGAALAAERGIRWDEM